MSTRNAGRIHGTWSVALMLAVLRALPSPGADVLAAGPPAPLTNEDIVRLVVNGTTEKAVLDAIGARSVDFDLSPAVLDELRAVGVGDRILEAMRRRQAAMPRSEPLPAPRAEEGAQGKVAIVFAPAPDRKSWSDHAAIAVRSLPRGARRPGGVEVAEVTELALAILCTTADHVPDHWDTRTPITGGPRHEVVLFHPGSVADRTKGFDVLYLDRQGIDPAPLAAGRHALLVALAGKQAGSGSWRLLASDAAKVDVRAGETTRIVLRARARVRGNAMIGIGVDQEWKVDSVDAPADPGGTPQTTPVSGGP